MITDIINKLRNEERGSILIQTGLMFSLLVALLGVGVDLGRAYLYRSQLSGALDEAALAGAKSFHSASRDDEIKAFFDSNFPGGRRFHFKEPSGNEFAVWSDAE
ncbi:pilus assembly protein TadG-related protein [Emcibacteraceae bacterium]|nr:pilus assembly protein TadG-related protein [Emcibacteraceae bacterium]